MTLHLPFTRGQLVVVVLHSPRERLWGALLGLEGPGLALRGLDVSPWEEVLTLVRQDRAGEVSLSTRFVPMHRIESLYLDERSSGVPSLGEVFLERTGIDPLTFLTGEEEP
jgi:hypothetical protein